MKRASFFDCYYEKVVKVPSEVLCFSSIIASLATERKEMFLGFPEPYFFSSSRCHGVNILSSRWRGWCIFGFPGSGSSFHLGWGSSSSIQILQPTILLLFSFLLEVDDCFYFIDLLDWCAHVPFGVSLYVLIEGHKGALLGSLHS